MAGRHLALVLVDNLGAQTVSDDCGIDLLKPVELNALAAV
jgi:hypothetical protein